MPRSLKFYVYLFFRKTGDHSLCTFPQHHSKIIGRLFNWKHPRFQLCQLQKSHDQPMNPLNLILRLCHHDLKLLLCQVTLKNLQKNLQRSEWCLDLVRNICHHFLEIILLLHMTTFPLSQHIRTFQNMTFQSSDCSFIQWMRKSFFPDIFCSSPCFLHRAFCQDFIKNISHLIHLTA